MQKVLLFILLLSFQLIARDGWAQAVSISGLVTSGTDNTSVPGATVAVKGTTTGTTTSADGKYTINVAPGKILVFSHIGFTTQEITVGSASTINVVLQDDSKSLSEVVVTAFGIKQETRGLGYAVQNVKAKEIVDSQQPNIVNALQGKVAGVQITNSGGAPGASSIMLIRGGTSLSGNNQPLYVVDGIPIDNTTPVGQGGVDGRYGAVLQPCRRHQSAGY
ncbi:carboxypeptidase-like regulatory domain-containing protein [Spirosoma endophyticum]|uniref:TonB-dependent Receptor Plug Domain n=1 Tax=Spirosoma endophyticum TaxID=662367 RepID=A0A1I1XL42_9BACT|nr:carboxypeptidase-like regulatory domain-containing protein [Spirosoma endophyticum]SFE08129.1 TonB-dependent Receptor Plug Domain [Spirosoma endophyticum]